MVRISVVRDGMEEPDIFTEEKDWQSCSLFPRDVLMLEILKVKISDKCTFTTECDLELTVDEIMRLGTCAHVRARVESRLHHFVPLAWIKDDTPKDLDVVVQDEDGVKYYLEHVFVNVMRRCSMDRRGPFSEDEQSTLLELAKSIGGQVVYTDPDDWHYSDARADGTYNWEPSPLQIAMDKLTGVITQT